jgi:hypothetical protein
LIGAAWLVDCGIHPERRAGSRIEPDGGKPFEIIWYQWWVGLPEHGGDKSTKRTDIAREAAKNAGWHTYKGDFGTFAFCHEADKEKALHYLEHRNDPAPPKAKKDRARKTTGPLPDFANMTREQIQAWEKDA